MTRKQSATTHKVNCIRLKLWPRRGLRISEEVALSAWLDDWRGDQLWHWDGETLAGDICSPDGFTTSDVVDALCALHSQPALAWVEVSAPHDHEKPATRWLRVYVFNPFVQPLCRLYEQRLISADVVIEALGGFAPPSRLATSYDTS